MSPTLPTMEADKTLNKPLCLSKLKLGLSSMMYTHWLLACYWLVITESNLLCKCRSVCPSAIVKL